MKAGKILGIHTITFLRKADWKNKTQETYESVSNINGLAEDEIEYLTKKLERYTSPRVNELKKIIQDANKELHDLLNY